MILLNTFTQINGGEIKQKTMRTIAEEAVTENERN